MSLRDLARSCRGTFALSLASSANDLPALVIALEAVGDTGCVGPTAKQALSGAQSMGGILPGFESHNSRLALLGIDRGLLKVELGRVEQSDGVTLATQREIFLEILERLVAKPDSKGYRIESSLRFDPGFIAALYYIADFELLRRRRENRARKEEDNGS